MASSMAVGARPAEASGGVREGWQRAARGKRCMASGEGGPVGGERRAALGEVGKSEASCSRCEMRRACRRI